MLCLIAVVATSGTITLPCRAAVLLLLARAATAAVDVSGPCTVVGSCARSPNYPSPYNDNQECTFTNVPTDSPLTANYFNVEFNNNCVWDYVTIAGNRYCGTTFPDGISAPGGTISWVSDFCCKPDKAGWEICWTPEVSMSKDPHSRMAHGARADFRGEPDEVFNVLSHKNVSMSVMFEEADFHWSKRLVHGTKIASAYWTLRDADNKTVTVAFTAHNKTEMHASRGFAAALTVSGAPVVVSDSKPYVAAGVSVSAVGRKLVVSAGGWEMSATNSPFPFASLNKGKMLLDIAIKPHYDVEKDPVAPHGLIGQSWDGDDYDYEGARDLDRSAETTTKAQGEGAIEGVIAEYKMSSAFATDFKYSRFGVSTPTPPRDVSKLTGRKIAKGGRPFVASAASAPVDMAETP